MPRTTPKRAAPARAPQKPPSIARAGRKPAARAVKTATTSPAPAPTAPAGSARPASKQARVIAMLRHPNGATIAEIAAVTGWQPHSIRGLIAGTLRKKLGLAIDSEKRDGRGRVYRIGA